LSKGFGLISRLSEEIDVTAFRDDIGEGTSIEELQALRVRPDEDDGQTLLLWYPTAMPTDEYVRPGALGDVRFIGGWLPSGAHEPTYRIDITIEHGLLISA
jgi:hypothetical protein